MIKKILNFTVSGQTLSTSYQAIASKTVKYVGATFELDDQWEGFDTVSAIWQGSNKTIATVLDSNGYVDIPHEVVEEISPVFVNLVGASIGEDVERLTTFPYLALRVTADAKINGTETEEVTPSQFEQFIAQVKDTEVYFTDTGDGGLIITKGAD